MEVFYAVVAGTRTVVIWRRHGPRVSRLHRGVCAEAGIGDNGGDCSEGAKEVQCYGAITKEDRMEKVS